MLNQTIFKFILLLLLVGQVSLSHGKGRFKIFPITGDDLILEFRSLFSKKLVDLSKNYITKDVGESTRLFYSHEETKCFEGVIPANSPVAKIKFKVLKEARKITEIGRYYSCLGDFFLTEKVITRGENLKAISYEQFVNGERTFKLRDGQNSFVYKLLDGSGDELFSFTITREDKKIIHDLKFLGEKVVRLIRNQWENERVGQYIFYPRNIKFNRPYASVKPSISNSKNRWKIEATAGNGRILYKSYNGKRVSLKKYFSLINHGGVKTMAFMKGIMKYYNYFFPKTNNVSTGTTSAKLLEELELIIIRLANNELNLIRIQILGFIENVKKNLILDKRQ